MGTDAELVINSRAQAPLCGHPTASHALPPESQTSRDRISSQAESYQVPSETPSCLIRASSQRTSFITCGGASKEGRSWSNTIGVKMKFDFPWCWPQFCCWHVLHSLSSPSWSLWRTIQMRLKRLRSKPDYLCVLSRMICTNHFLTMMRFKVKIAVWASLGANFSLCVLQRDYIMSCLLTSMRTDAMSSLCCHHFWLPLITRHRDRLCIRHRIQCTASLAS